MRIRRDTSFPFLSDPDTNSRWRTSERGLLQRDTPTPITEERGEATAHSVTSQKESLPRVPLRRREPAEERRDGGREARTRRINPPHTVSERLLETVMDSDTIAGLTKRFPASALSAKHTKTNPDVGLIRRVPNPKKKKRKISLPSSSETPANFFLRDQG